MSRATKGAVAVAALATTVATKQARKVLAPHDPPGWGRGQGRRTHVVTVNLPAERVREREDLLAGLRELPAVTVDVRPAPADKGTELAVNGEDHDTIRKALRETKALKQQLRLQTGRPTAVREAIYNARKGGSVFILGVFGGFVDKFPLGAVINKGLTVRGAQQPGQAFIPRILEHMARGEILSENFATHRMGLDDGPHGYEIFKDKKDGNVRSVFLPHGA